MPRQRPWENVGNRRRDFYVYESESLLLAAGGSSADTIAIEADSDFILQKLTYLATVGDVQSTDATRIIPNVLIQITDTGSGRQLMQDAIPVSSFFGSGMLPFILPNPRLFMRNSTIQIAYTSFETAAVDDVRLAFIGYKIYGTA